MFRSLSTRLFASHLLLAIFVIALMGAVSSLLFRYYYIAQTRATLTVAGEDLAATMARLMGRPDAADRISLVTHAAGRALNGRVCVFDSHRNHLIASSDLKGNAQAPDADDFACSEGGTSRVETTQVACHPGPVISVLVPIREANTGRALGALLLRRPLREVETTLRLSTLLAGASGALATALALLLSAIASRAIARPLSAMARTASDLADGDLSARVERQGPVELRTLASSLNHMASALERAFSTLSDEREQLAGILASMTEGVVALDREGQVLTSNAGAQRLLGAAVAPGADLPAEVGEGPGADLARLARGEVPRAQGMLVRGDRHLSLHGATAHGAQGGAVIVISDVTEAQRLERLRREFVANASHELRAPLTSIRGFLQALADGTAETEEDRRRCVQVAAEQAAMMKRLVDQLLDLSRLQARVVELDREPIALPELAAGAVAGLSPQATARQASVVVESPPGVPLVSGDGGRLMQVMMNLLDNAIRYSPAGGRVTVRVLAESLGGRNGVRVEVQDQGPGIAPEDLDAVWERFHKADRARQRSESGAGLGLAIAREIVHAHGGEVRAANAPGGGALMSFWLPAP